MATVRDLLTQKGNEVITIDAEDTVLSAAKRMNQHSIGSVIVTNDLGEVVGIFTERDVLVKVVAAHRDPILTRVREVMTDGVICCTPDVSLEDCKRVMSTRRIRHVPVLEESGELVGIVTSGDVQAREVAEQKWEIQELNEYIHGPTSVSN